MGTDTVEIDVDPTNAVTTITSIWYGTAPELSQELPNSGGTDTVEIDIPIQARPVTTITHTMDWL